MSELDVAAREIKVLALLVGKLASQDMERRLQAQGVALSILQAGILWQLRRGSATISGLSSALLAAPATLVPSVDALERKGLVRRRPDLDDRRRKSLSLTPAGASLLDSITPLATDASLSQSLAAMGPEASHQLAGLLRELANQMTGNERLVDRALKAVRVEHPAHPITP